MTWLLDGSATTTGATDWDRLAAQHPDAFAALSGVVAAAWEDTDPALLELARLRVATLLGNTPELTRRSERARAAGLSDAKVADVAAWPTSPLFTDRERACLALTEQFVIDANGVTDQHVADVTAHLGGPGCYAFVAAVSALETFQRACLTLGIRSAPGIDDLAGASAHDHASGR
jgi:alkylhydroperoxidase family enzyme